MRHAGKTHVRLRVLDEEDVDLFYDLDVKGWARRAVTQLRSTGVIEGAVDRTEWFIELHGGDVRLYRYMAHYGSLPEVQIEGHDLGSVEVILQATFESVWCAARAVHN